MSFSGTILREVSYDPYYKAEFTYERDGLKIRKGYADIVRRQPKLEITYDDQTVEMLDEDDSKRIELELANLVLSHFIQGKDIRKLLADRK